MFPESQRAALVAKLADSFKSSALELFTANGQEIFNFSVAAPNVAQILIDFYNQNNRFPKLIFNDGIPPSLKSQIPIKDAYGVGINDLIRWDTLTGTIQETENGPVLVSGASLPFFNVKFKTIDVLNMPVIVARTENGDVTESVNVAGIYNGRFSASGEMVSRIRNADIVGGAFQTWGILLVCLSRPDFCYATDDGILLTSDGVSMIENSLAYWANVAIQYAPSGQVPAAPYLVGVPSTLIQKLKQMTEQIRSTRQSFAMEVFGIVMSFVGFYFGAAAFSGLIGGAFTIPNLAGSLNMASKFGIDTGNVSTYLKLIDSTGFTPDTVINTARTHAMDDYDFWADIGIDPASMSTFQPASSDWMDDFWVNAGLEDFISGLDALGNVGFDAVQIGMENDAALLDQVAGSVGPLSVAQIAQAAKTTPAVAAAASTAMKLTGANPGSVAATSQQAQSAAAVANQKAAQARSSGDTGNASIWETAGKLLTTYANYQLQEKAIELKAQSSALPNSTIYPSSSSAVRQPDGSITVRNSDGSYTTIKPNGQIVGTPSGGTLPAFFNTKNLLIVGGVTAAGAALYLLTRSRK